MMSFTKAHSQDGGLLIFLVFLRRFFVWRIPVGAGTLLVPLHRLNNWKILVKTKEREPRWHRYQTVVWLAPSLAPFFLPFSIYSFLLFLVFFPLSVWNYENAVAFPPRRATFSVNVCVYWRVCVCFVGWPSDRRQPTTQTVSSSSTFFSSLVCYVFLFAREPLRSCGERKTHSCVTPAGVLVC